MACILSGEREREIFKAQAAGKVENYYFWTWHSIEGVGAERLAIIFSAASLTSNGTEVRIQKICE